MLCQLSYGGWRRQAGCAGKASAPDVHLDGEDIAARRGETDRVLSRPERLLAVAAALVLGSAVVITMTMDGRLTRRP